MQQNIKFANKKTQNKLNKRKICKIKRQNKTKNIKYANNQTKNVEFKNTHALAH